MLSSDSSGFLTGAPATDLMKRLADGQDAELDLLRSIKMDTKGMLKQARARNELVRSAVAIPTVRPRSAAARALAAGDSLGALKRVAWISLSARPSATP